MSSLIGNMIDVSRSRIQEAVALLRSKLRFTAQPPPREDRSLALGGLEERLLLSAVPMPPELVAPDGDAASADPAPVTAIDADGGSAS